jgi:glycosyltransferase involved in cell wall biosynthesis
LISVVVPCGNEAEVIEETNRQLQSVLMSGDFEYEILYVDDGSSDETFKILERLHQAHPSVRVIALSRNFGHQAAITAGMENSSGNAVILIDADMQDPPEVILEMVARWQGGADVVYGQRVSREGETALKTLTAKAFYRILNVMSDINIPVDTGDFRLMDRKVVDAFLKMPERHRFVRGMVSWLGFNQAPVAYRRAPRLAGQTKYPFSKMLRFALDGMFSFSRAPLRLVNWLGFLCSFVAFLGIVVTLVVRLFTNAWVPGWAALFIALLFLGGIQLISLGIIGEYIGRIYDEVKGRPLYVLQERLGFGEGREPEGDRYFEEKHL